MKTIRNYRKSLVVATAVVLTLGLAAESFAAGDYGEVYSFAQVAGTTGSTKNFGAAVDVDAVYFSLSSGAGITKVDASGTSVLMTDTDWLTATGETGMTTFYAFEVMGDKLVFGESSTDAVWAVDKTTGAISTVASKAEIMAFTGELAASLLSWKGVCGDDYYFYESTSDSILKVNVPSSTLSTAVSKAQLDGFMNSTRVTGGFAFDDAGDLYFGNSETDDIVKWDGSAGSTILTMAEITALTGAESVLHGDLLYGEDGLMYFYEGKADAILSFDPANAAATLKYVLTENQLLNGPMASDNVSGLAWYDGRLAFTGMDRGFYAVPEPTVLGLLLGLFGFAMLRRSK